MLPVRQLSFIDQSTLILIELTFGSQAFLPWSFFIILVSFLVFILNNLVFNSFYLWFLFKKENIIIPVKPIYCVNKTNKKNYIVTPINVRKTDNIKSFFKINFWLECILYMGGFIVTIPVMFISYISYITPIVSPPQPWFPSHLKQLQEVSLFYFI
jgi:hypothetical protein